MIERGDLVKDEECTVNKSPNALASKKRGPALSDESTTAGHAVEGEMKIYNLLAKYYNNSNSISP